MGGIISAGINGIFGLSEAAVQTASAERINDEQLDDAEKTRLFNASEAEKQRLFQTGERESSQQYLSSEWNRQFSEQNIEYWKRLQDEREYNSPTAQAKRLREAGINSSALAGGSQIASDSTFGVPSSTSVASPSPSTGAAATGSPVSGLHVPNLSAIGDIATGIGSLMKSISESKLNDAQKHRLSSLLSGEVESQMLANQGKKLINEYQDISNYIQKSTKDKQIQKAFQELVNMKAQNYLLGTQGEYYGAQADLTMENKFLAMAKRRLTDEQYNKLVIDVRNADMMYRSQIAMMNARTSDLNESATARKYANTIGKIYSEFYSKPENAASMLSTLLTDLRTRAVRSGNKEMIAKCDSILGSHEYKSYLKHPNHYGKLRFALDRTHELLQTLNPLIEGLPKIGGYGRESSGSRDFDEETSYWNY